MKKTYTSPEMEIDKFKAESSILTGSEPSTTTPWTPDTEF